MPNIQLINDIKVRKIPCPPVANFFRLDIVQPGHRAKRFAMAWNDIQEVYVAMPMM